MVDLTIDGGLDLTIDSGLDLTIDSGLDLTIDSGLDGGRASLRDLLGWSAWASSSSIPIVVNGRGRCTSISS